jgi:hypothetical protein
VLLGLAMLVWEEQAFTERKQFLVFATAMRNPLVGPDNTTTQWELLRFPGLGNRYYFLPMIGFLASLIWMANSASTTKLARYSARAILLLCTDRRLSRLATSEMRGISFSIVCRAIRAGCAWNYDEHSSESNRMADDAGEKSHSNACLTDAQ